jgi:hypothetical protein
MKTMGLKDGIEGITYTLPARTERFFLLLTATIQVRCAREMTSFNAHSPGIVRSMLDALTFCPIIDDSAENIAAVPWRLTIEGWKDADNDLDIMEDILPTRSPGLYSPWHDTSNDFRFEPRIGIALAPRRPEKSSAVYGISSDSRICIATS